MAGRLRAQGLRCQTLAVSIKDPSLKTISRQRQLPYAANQTKLIYDTALEIVKESWNLRAPIRLLGVAATNLTTGVAFRQLDFFSTTTGEEDLRQQRLDKAVDQIRSRFGGGALKHASLMSSDIIHNQEKKDAEMPPESE